MFMNLSAKHVVIAFLWAMFVTSDCFVMADDRPITVTGALVTVIQERNIAASETGLISKVHFKAGEFVDAGAVLAELDSTQAQLKLQEAEIQFGKALELANSDVENRAAKKSLQVSKAELARAQEAVDRFSKSISQTEMDRLRLTTERAELLIEQSDQTARIAKLDADLRRNQVDFARHTLDRHRVLTPIFGMVVQVSFHPGEWVETGKSVARVLRLDRLGCEGHVASEAVDVSMIGRPVNVTIHPPNGKSVTLPGTLTFVDPQVSRIKKDVLIRAEFDNAKLTILPGMSAEIEISGSSKIARNDAPGSK
ncbi:MAG: efflux RND transporter periplasmic adaptor subunit [Rhodopirellula sp.]|nr:efflux RND transporter periplasmic adaptor subunit [Rhodopirellula sp.]